MNPKNLKYSETHEWVKVEGEIATIGITSRAQDELKDIVYVELPEVGKVVSKGDSVLVIESVKTVLDLHAPISGEIFEVNQALSGEPSLVNRDPYEKGWIFKIKIKDDAELESLMSVEDYDSKVGEE